MGDVTYLGNVRFDKPYYLGIKIGDSSELSPRRQIVSVPYAIYAEYAGNVGYNRFVEFTESGTFAVPVGVTSITVEVWGAGGGGGGGAIGHGGGGGGGGSGGYAKGTINVKADQQYNIIIGTGGIGGAAAEEGGDNGFSGEAGDISKIESESKIIIFAEGGEGGMGGYGGGVSDTCSVIGVGGMGGNGGNGDPDASISRTGNMGRNGGNVKYRVELIGEKQEAECNLISYSGGLGGDGAVSISGTVVPLGSNGGKGGRADYLIRFTGETRIRQAGQKGGNGFILISY